MSVLCIVPSPRAAARASRRLCDAQDGILFGPQVSTLERIAGGILSERGDRRPVLSPLAERLLLLRAAADAGGPFAGAPPGGGLAGSLASAIAELRRGEVGAEEARSAAEGAEGGPRDRLLALAAVLAAYEAALSGLGVLDRPAALRAAAEAARRRSRGAADGPDLLVVDGIAAASPAERDLLAALAAGARRARFHLPYFPERPDLCAPAEPLLRAVESLHEAAARREVEVVLPSLEGEGRASRLSALLGGFAGGSATADPGGGGAAGIVLAEAGAGEADEAEAAARVAARLLDAGFRPEEIVLVAPSPRRSAPLLARAFAAAGVPFAAGRGGALAEAPPVRALLDALAAADGLDRSSAARLAASTYLAPQGVPGGLDRLLDRAGALDGRAAPQEALRARARTLAASSEREALLRAAEALDRLERDLRPLGADGTARRRAARLAAFVDGSGLRRRAARGPRDVVARDLAAVAGLLEAAEGLARALTLLGRGEERLDARAWRTLLSLAVDEGSLPAPPEPAAGAVELFGLDEAPGLGARAVLLPGCARGAWPPPPPAEPVLREPERRALCARLRRAAVPTSGARRAEAVFRAFSAVAAGREAVAFLWPAPGPGGDGGPISPVVEEALAAAGVEVPAGPAAGPALGAARSVREALRAAARGGAEAQEALRGTPLGPRLRQAAERGRIEAERAAAVAARRASPWAGEAAGAGGALGEALPEEWSPTQLERYVRCPFRHFLESVARVEEPGDDALDIDVRDEGSLLHAVLERFVRARVERGAWPPTGSEEDLAEARAVAGQAFARFEREGRVGDPSVFAARQAAILARLDRVVRAEARDHGGLFPASLEHAFGGRSGRPPVEVAADGETVRLRGRIDRVDAGPDRLLVLDYKSGRGGRSARPELLDPASFGATSFQLPTYLLAAARDLPGRARLLATYAILRDAERLEPVEVPAEALHRDAGDGRSFAGAVVGLVRRIRKGEFPIVSRDCERCPWGAACRFQGAAELSPGEEAA